MICNMPHPHNPEQPRGDYETDGWIHIFKRTGSLEFQEMEKVTIARIDTTNPKTLARDVAACMREACAAGYKQAQKDMQRTLGL